MVFSIGKTSILHIILFSKLQIYRPSFRYVVERTKSTIKMHGIKLAEWLNLAATQSSSNWNHLTYKSALITAKRTCGWIQYCFAKKDMSQNKKINQIEINRSMKWIEIEFTFSVTTFNTFPLRSEIIGKANRMGTIKRCVGKCPTSQAV